MEYLRIWREIEISEIQDHIIMVNDMFGFCPACKKIGIELHDLTKCPSCGREIKYVTSKDAQNNKIEIVARIKKKLPDLIFVDYNDYERVTGKKKAESLFNV